jgi:hypothetical protein
MLENSGITIEVGDNPKNQNHHNILYSGELKYLMKNEAILANLKPSNPILSNSVTLWLFLSNPIGKFDILF